jgi:hypothetical protein
LRGVVHADIISESVVVGKWKGCALRRVGNGNRFPYVRIFTFCYQIGEAISGLAIELLNRAIEYFLYFIREKVRRPTDKGYRFRLVTNLLVKMTPESRLRRNSAREIRQ